MKAAFLIAVIAGCTACVGNAQVAPEPIVLHTVRAANFIYDDNAPPVIADEYLYDTNQPVLRAKEFLLKDKQ
jgi:hypothetical protein